MMARQPNWQDEEKHKLINIVGKYYDVVENKETDAVSNKIKKQTWYKMSLEFNKGSETLRSDAELITMWKSLKKGARSYSADLKKETYKTGGGTKNIRPNPIFDAVLGVLSTTVEGLSNPFDSDSYEDSWQTWKNKQENIHPGDVSMYSEKAEESHDWSGYQPKNLQSHISKPLRKMVDYEKRPIKDYSMSFSGQKRLLPRHDDFSFQHEVSKRIEKSLPTRDHTGLNVRNQTPPTVDLDEYNEDSYSSIHSWRNSYSEEDQATTTIRKSIPIRDHTRSNIRNKTQKKIYFERNNEESLSTKFSWPKEPPQKYPRIDLADNDILESEGIRNESTTLVMEIDGKESGVSVEKSDLNRSSRKSDSVGDVFTDIAQNTVAKTEFPPDLQYLQREEAKLKIELLKTKIQREKLRMSLMQTGSSIPLIDILLPSTQVELSSDLSEPVVGK